MKNKIIWIAVPLFLLAGYIFMQRLTIDKLKQQSQVQAFELSTLKDSVMVHRNKNHELTYKLTTVEIERSNLKKSLAAAGYDIKQLKEREIKWKKIASTLKVQLEATGRGQATLRDTIEINNTDTIHVAAFSWNNNYLFLSGNLQNKQMNFDYKYKVGIDFITARHRRATTISIITTDPNAAITTGHSITVEQKTKLWEKPWLWGIAGIIGGYMIGN